MSAPHAMRIAQQVDPDQAREAARDILSDRRFRSDPAPRPLRGPLQWIGRRIQAVLDKIGDWLRPIPGWVLLAIVILVLAAIIWRIVVVMRRRRVSGMSLRRGRADADATVEDPDALERDADDAERRGDLERAVRLRFRAGLLRLGRRGAITYRPSVTTGEVRHAIGSDTFDDLAETFDAVAYGGRKAQPPDVDAARRDWPHVLEDTRRQ